MRSLIIALLQIYLRILSFEKRLIFDRIMAMSLVCSFYGPPCTMRCDAGVLLTENRYLEDLKSDTGGATTRAR